MDKADKGKPRYDLVPIQELWTAIARVREYGVEKYGDSECWKDVSSQRYRAALYRHIAAEVNDPGGLDEESGLPHIYHAACNLAFILELESKKETK